VINSGRVYSATNSEVDKNNKIVDPYIFYMLENSKILENEGIDMFKNTRNQQ